jgi:hypothetical protein
VDFRAFSWPQYLGLGSWFRSESDRNSPPMTRMSADGDPAFATPFDTAQALTERGTRTHKRLSWIGSPSRHPQIRFNPRDPIRLRSGPESVERLREMAWLFFSCVSCLFVAIPIRVDVALADFSKEGSDKRDERSGEQNAGDNCASPAKPWRTSGIRAE